MIKQSRLLMYFCILIMCGLVMGADWPGWRGPGRDGKSAETGLLSEWPEGGPELIWSFEGLGTGYSSVAVVDDTVYTTGMIDGRGVAFAFDSQGQLLWQRDYGPEWTRSHGGARTTPTYSQGKLYLMSGLGRVVCLDAADGQVVWSVDTAQKFDLQQPRWGIAESVLVDDDRVYCTPGGTEATFVAFDKQTGQVVWSTDDFTDASSYCSMLMIERGQRRLLVTMTDNYVVFVDADSGEIVFKDAVADYLPTGRNIHPNTPVYNDGMVYTTSGYDRGGAMHSVCPQGVEFERVWIDETLDVHIGGVVEIDGYIYGSNWIGNGNGNWCCLDWQSGEVMYEQHWHNKGSVIYAQGHLYCYVEGEGQVALVRAGAQGFDVVSSFAVELGDGPHWAHPAISNGRLYIRHGGALMCYDIRAD